MGGDKSKGSFLMLKMASMGDPKLRVRLHCRRVHKWAGNLFPDDCEICFFVFLSFVLLIVAFGTIFVLRSFLLNSCLVVQCLSFVCLHIFLFSVVFSLVWLVMLASHFFVFFPAGRALILLFLLRSFLVNLVWWYLLLFVAYFLCSLVDVILDFVWWMLRHLFLHVFFSSFFYGFCSGMLCHLLLRICLLFIFLSCAMLVV